MSVQLLKDLRIGGSVSTAGTVITSTTDFEAGLVAQRLATWSGPDLSAQTASGQPRILGQQTVAQSKSDADTAESAALFTLVIPGRTLDVNGSLLIEPLYKVTNDADTKRLRGRFGGTVLWNFDLTTHQVLPWRFLLTNRNSLSSQVAGPNSSTCWGTVSSVSSQTFNIDFATDQVLTLTAQWPSAAASGRNITLERCIVWYHPGS